MHNKQHQATSLPAWPAGKQGGWVLEVRSMLIPGVCIRWPLKVPSKANNFMIIWRVIWPFTSPLSVPSLQIYRVVWAAWSLVQDPAVQTAVIPLGRAWETSGRSELLLICPIRCLSLNNVPAISLLLSSCCRETSLKMDFDFQLCETCLQTGTWVPPEFELLLGNGQAVPFTSCCTSTKMPFLLHIVFVISVPLSQWASLSTLFVLDFPLPRT